MEKEVQTFSFMLNNYRQLLRYGSKQVIVRPNEKVRGNCYNEV